MTLKINSVAPDFKAKTSEGDISFHEWLGDSWGVLFSHPKDFTPVCTTELGSLASMKPEFDRRNVKVIGLSVDEVDDHIKWLNDIKDVTVTKPNFHCREIIFHINFFIIFFIIIISIHPSKTSQV